MINGINRISPIFYELLYKSRININYNLITLKVFNGFYNIFNLICINQYY